MNFAHVRALLAKELLDVLRDRRTLFVMLVMPFLSYPLIIVIMLQLALAQTRNIASQPAAIACVGGTADPELRAFLDEQAVANNWQVTDTADGAAAREAVRSGACALAVEVTAPAGDGSGAIAILYSAANELSGMVRGRMRDACMEYNGRVVVERLKALGKDRSFIEPYAVSDANLAPAEQVGAFVLGRNITLIMIVMLVVGAFYPALEATAGERERRTLETLLVSPAGRPEIALAKYLAVCACSLVTGVLNLCSMVITFTALMPAEIAARFPVALAPTTIAAMLVVMVPLAAFVSAVLLGFATYARSYKEGQSYLSPLVMFLTLPAMVTLLPGAALTPFTALIPVTNIALLASGLMLGTVPVGPALLALAATGFYVWLALTWCARLFTGEAIIFRVGNPFRWRELTAAHGFLAAAAAVAAMVYAAGAGGMAPSLFWHIFFPQLAFLVLTIGLVRLVGAPWRPALALNLPAGGRGWLRSAGGLVFMAGVVMLITGLFPDAGGKDQGMVRELVDGLGLNLPARLVCLALIPGIVEELLFRGLILTGFRRTFGAWKAVVLCGLVFGFIHLVPYKLLPVGIMGAGLALVVVQTGSIIPAIIVHVVNNAIGVMAGDAVSPAPAGGVPVGLIVAGLVLAAGGYAVLRRGPGGPDA
ncbi:MAG: ABC transporter permease subunit/CPBP intramembrane protease [Planctomycetota bacterium]